MSQPSKVRNLATQAYDPKTSAFGSDGTLHADSLPALLRLSRRAFLATSGSVLASLGVWDRMVQAQPQPEVNLSGENTEAGETPIYRLRLGHRNGNLVGLTWKDPSLEIIQEPRLGENFRILLPRPGYEANYFTSSDQKVSRIEKTETGVTCTYDTLRNARDTLNVKVHYHIAAVDKRLEFTIEVENPTELPLAEVFWGIVGGQQGLVNRQDTESLVPGWDLNAAPGVFTKFRPNGVNLGIRYEMAEYSYPSAEMMMGWMEFFNRKENLGLYYATHDSETRLTGLYFELRPFSKQTTVGDNWPTPADVPAGEPIGLTMGWLNFPYLKQGTFKSGPMVLQLHRGDWHEGSELYRAWYDQHFHFQRPLTWLRKEMTWQSIILYNPEDVIAWKFKDLPKLAADAKKYGVTTFEVTGWNIGGIDRGYPQYRPDPRLGTHEEFGKLWRRSEGWECIR